MFLDSQWEDFRLVGLAYSVYLRKIELFGPGFNAKTPNPTEVQLCFEFDDYKGCTLRSTIRLSSTYM